MTTGAGAERCSGLCGQGGSQTRFCCSSMDESLAITELGSSHKQAVVTLRPPLGAQKALSHKTSCLILTADVAVIDTLRKVPGRVSSLVAQAIKRLPPKYGETGD